MTSETTTPSPASWRRRLADAVARHAMRVMPDSLAQWSGAMRTELAHVADDRDALRWAIGCASVAYRARLRALYLLDIAIVRAAGVLLVLLRAFDVTLPSLMTAAYRLNARGLQEGLGGTTPGDNYQRLIPLMEAIPGWLHVLVVAAGICYIVTAMYLLARRRAAAFVLVAGVLLEFLAQVISRPVLAAVGVVVTPNPSMLAAWLLPVVFPLLVAAAAWSGSRTALGSLAKHGQGD